MAKPYNQQLAEWVRQRTQSARRDRNRVAFLAVTEDVREALDQGWPVKTVWAHMMEQRRIGFGYDTFRTYVKRYLRPAAEPAPRRTRRSRAPPVAAAKPLPRERAESETAHAAVDAPVQDKLPGFTFNAAPNREELI